MKKTLGIISLLLVSLSVSYGNSEFEDAVIRLHENNLTKYSTTQEYRGNDTLLREQASKFFAEYGDNIMNLDQVLFDCSFSDLRFADQTLTDSIVKACELGIMNAGTRIAPQRTSHPKQALTNAEAITVVIRLYFGKQDESGNIWYRNYYTLANQYGLLSDLYLKNIGTANSPATRKEVGIILYRASLLRGSKTQISKIIGTDNSDQGIVYNNTSVNTIDNVYNEPAGGKPLDSLLTDLFAGNTNTSSSANSNNNNNIISTIGSPSTQSNQQNANSATCNNWDTVIIDGNQTMYSAIESHMYEGESSNRLREIQNLAIKTLQELEYEYQLDPDLLYTMPCYEYITMSMRLQSETIKEYLSMRDKELCNTFEQQQYIQYIKDDRRTLSTSFEKIDPDTYYKLLPMIQMKTMIRVNQEKIAIGRLQEALIGMMNDLESMKAEYSSISKEGALMGYSQSSGYRQGLQNLSNIISSYETEITKKSEEIAVCTTLNEELESLSDMIGDLVQ